VYIKDDDSQSVSQSASHFLHRSSTILLSISSGRTSDVPGSSKALISIPQTNSFLKSDMLVKTVCLLQYFPPQNTMSLYTEHSLNSHLAPHHSSLAGSRSRRTSSPGIISAHPTHLPGQQQPHRNQRGHEAQPRSPHPPLQIEREGGPTPQRNWLRGHGEGASMVRPILHEWEQGLPGPIILLVLPRHQGELPAHRQLDELLRHVQPEPTDNHGEVR